MFWPSIYIKLPLTPPNLDDTPRKPVTTSQQVHEYRAIVKDTLHDAVDESTIFMCGINASNRDDLCYDMVQCDPSLERASLVELDFNFLRF